MAGISSQAMAFGKINKYRFQRQEQQSKEFADGSGLEMYEFKFRFDDPQIGRFWSVDPLADKYVYNSTYAFSEDKVTGDIELEGLETASTTAEAISDLQKAGLITDKDADRLIFNAPEVDNQIYAKALPIYLTVLTGGLFGPEAATLAGISLITGVPVTPSPEAMAGPVLEDAAAVTTQAGDAENSGITLYRGVNESHPGFDDASNGIAIPRGGAATPAEHNEGNTQSPYTSWTTDPDVATNFALRPGGNGVVLSKTFAQDATVVSPNVKDVKLIQAPIAKNESEVLIKGPVTGATPRFVTPADFTYHP
jgi:hypothetical protein